MRWASLAGFGGRIPPSSGTIEPVERFLTTVPDNPWLGQPPAPRSPWVPSMVPGLGHHIQPAVLNLVFLPDSRGSTHGLTDR